MASHVSILTSSYIDEHHIPGHRWLNRDSHKVVNYLGPLGSKKVNRDVAKTISSIFTNSAFKTFSVQEPVTLDVDRKIILPRMRAKGIMRKASRLVLKNPNSTIAIWLPKVDELSHRYGPDSRQVAAEMVDTSKAFGSFVLFLKKQGLLGGARILFLPDHGQRRVAQAKGVQLKKIMELTGEKFLINPMFFANKNLILTSGDSFAQIYFEPHSSLTKAVVAERIRSEKTIELICWRDEEKWFFVNRFGSVEVEPLGDDCCYVKLLDGVNPLGAELMGNINLSEPVLDKGKYPDFLHQIMRSYVTGRSGDLFLFAAKDFHFGVSPRIGWNFGRHKGTHGGPFEDEVMVAAICYGFDVPKKSGIRSADLIQMLGLV